ncbi:helix-turn-helix domain-containing protein [Streptomyces sp. NPDC006134]|uniref:helix-turn-helix domain-containing protein n=1 Tax=Streptomyces sp. NPDC006134 TaxID=3154467 RepID=UPI0033DB3242
MGAVRAGTAVPPDTDGATSLQATLSGWLAPVLVRPGQGGPGQGSPGQGSPGRGGPAGGTVVLHRFGYVRLIVCEAAGGTGPLRLSRTRRLIAGDTGDTGDTGNAGNAGNTGGGGDGVVLVLPRAGAVRLAQDGRTATVTAGDLALLDLRVAFSLEQEGPGRVLLFRIPAHALNVPAPVLRSVTGRAVTAARGVPALLAPLLLDLEATADRVPRAVGERLGGVVTEFVAALVNELTEDGDDPPWAGPGHLVAAVRRYVDEHLGDPGLSAEGIAAAHGISVRYLHRLFEAEGITVGRLIQRRRVERCAQELTRRGRVSSSVTAVVLSWGFRSPAHFSRAFRAVHGYAPRYGRTAADGRS